MDSKIILKRLTNKGFIVLTESGNHAIKEALRLADRKKTLVQDQGGWLTYKKYPKGIIELKTDEGVLDLDDLKGKADEDSVLLINSLSGYFATQPMEKISSICKNKNCLVINDASGSIGTELAKYGDVIIGSFSKWKPVNLGYGGFIATNFKFEIKESFDGVYENRLIKRLVELPERLNKLYKISEKVKKDLDRFKIIHKESKGLNVVMEYEEEKEKNKIIKYCKNNSLEYTICPRYIRVNKKAISIEVKRK